jgi:hypothetical protein
VEKVWASFTHHRGSVGHDGIRCCPANRVAHGQHVGRFSHHARGNHATLLAYMWLRGGMRMDDQLGRLQDAQAHAFLCFRGCLAYVGRSACLRCRMAAHSCHGCSYQQDEYAAVRMRSVARVFVDIHSSGDERLPVSRTQLCSLSRRPIASQLVLMMQLWSRNQHANTLQAHAGHGREAGQIWLERRATVGRGRTRVKATLVMWVVVWSECCMHYTLHVRGTHSNPPFWRQVTS